MKTNVILQGDVLEKLKELPDESVDCIITSPPYWGLRDYGESTCKIWDGNPNCEHEFEIKDNVKFGLAEAPEPSGLRNKLENLDDKGRGKKEIRWKSGFCKKCGAWYGQLGLEPTLDLYLDHLFEIMKELKRVLKKTGVIFWNHGDCYGGVKYGKTDKKVSEYVKDSQKNLKKVAPSYSKCMMLQNYRFILQCINKLGLILRNIIIWYKPNHMPSSVKDRFTNAYEPVFMLVKNKKYYFDLDAVRIPHKNPNSKAFNIRVRDVKKGRIKAPDRIASPKEIEKYIEGYKELNPLGKNPGDLWTIPTQPFPEAHFATFPERLVEPMIKAGCPQWICKKCGKARERITKKKLVVRKEFKDKGKAYQNVASGSKEMPAIPRARTGLEGHNEYYTIGWTDCGCNAGWRPGIVLDPFFGSGTTGLVALKLGRNFIGIELNPDYIKIAKKRLEKWLKQTRLF